MNQPARASCPETPVNATFAPAAPLLVTDWRDFVFLHFALPADELAPHVPFPLDLCEGRAFVSLVSFRFERARPARLVPPALGRLLLRPFSNHQFLNLRTYVRGPAGPGIHFIAEWIDNPLSLRVGPITYGLPYRLARMSRVMLPGSGLRRILISERKLGVSASLVVPASADRAPSLARSGSADAFLLERHLAYTHRRGIGRVFAVQHPPWQAAPFQLARLDTRLIEATFPWFARAEFVGGHFAGGFSEIRISAPHRCAKFAPQALSASNCARDAWVPLPPALTPS